MRPEATRAGLAGRAASARLGHFLTVEQVAATLQVHPESVRRWIRAGRLPAAQLGGRRIGYRIDERDLRRFFAAGRALVSGGQTSA